jgi:hypothetical protein
LPGASSICHDTLKRDRHDLVTRFHTKNEERSGTYRPNTRARALELLEKVRFALGRSFLSYAHSSAIFADRVRQAVNVHKHSIVRKERKRSKMTMGKINTHWYLHRSGAQIREGRMRGRDGSSQVGRCMRELK